MKEKIIYAVSFVFVFAIITGLLIYLNSTYKNIFSFDFSSPGQMEAVDSVQNVQKGLAEQKGDTSAVNKVKQDTTKQNLNAAKIDSSASVQKDSAAVSKVQPAVVNTPKSTDPELKTNIKEKNIAKRDSVYKSWVKSTGKLYETMDSKKAAKIIQGYSDNIARDLLLIMKKKKAAEIIAEFKPDVATRIISAQQ